MLIIDLIYKVASAAVNQAEVKASNGALQPKKKLTLAQHFKNWLSRRQVAQLAEQIAEDSQRLAQLPGDVDLMKKRAEINHAGHLEQINHWAEREKAECLLNLALAEQQIKLIELELDHE